MYLSEVNLWNFRKYGIQGDTFEEAGPGVTVMLNGGLNVLIGENDSGKTAIIDAIRYILGTQSREWNRLEEEDFHQRGVSRATQLKIECIFRQFTHQEAGSFLEWMGFEEFDGVQEYVLSVRLTAQRKPDRIITDLRAGPDPIGTSIDGDARELIRVTYLKPLRDAENELTPGVRSRFAQILKAHPLFQKSVSDSSKRHELEKLVEEANDGIKKYFAPAKDDKTESDRSAGQITKTLNDFLEEFFPKGVKAEAHVSIAGGELNEILRRLELSLEENKSGLGSLNLLYIAAELLLLELSRSNGLRLALIEELEAHLHPQAQLRLVHFLQRESARGQFILTTHSTTLGASVDLSNLIICKDDKVFPMGPAFTNMEPKNYEFLHRFLDATKANLFFARGVILVEGDAENLLIPTLAEILECPLHRYGVSVVNVGSTAFLHYAKIFHRKDNQQMGIKVAVVTDMDVKPLEWANNAGNSPTSEDVEEAKRNRRESLADLKTGDIGVFVSPNWTLEYEISLTNLRTAFYRSVLWADKKQNAKSGLPKDEKWTDVKEKAIQDIEEWSTRFKSSPRQAAQVAFEIYHNVMIAKDISKAITAQVFADELRKSFDDQKKRDALLKALLQSEPIKYLLDAICHVTEPLPEKKHDSDN